MKFKSLGILHSVKNNENIDFPLFCLNYNLISLVHSGEISYRSEYYKYSLKGFYFTAISLGAVHL